jgi:hypothetical protein
MLYQIQQVSGIKAVIGPVQVYDVFDAQQAGGLPQIVIQGGQIDIGDAAAAGQPSPQMTKRTLAPSRTGGRWSRRNPTPRHPDEPPPPALFS